MIMWSSHQEYITVVHICALSIAAPKYIKQILTVLKGEINNNIITKDFNILLSRMHRSFRQKFN